MYSDSQLSVRQRCSIKCLQGMQESVFDRDPGWSVRHACLTEELTWMLVCVIARDAG